MREIGVALLGLGNVGGGVIKLLSDNAEAIEARLGARVAVRGVAVRDPEKEREVAVESSLLTTDVDGLIDRDDVEIVCELVGGEAEAKDYVLRAIQQGKHVVTANKALLAVHGDAVFSAAEKHRVDVYYEAAVCGGVPIIRALREGLASDRIEDFVGIVNGTSNYILTTMAEEGGNFADVLSDAQRLGYAEADPTLDVSGGDAAHKLAILAMLCFGSRIDVGSLFVEGIDGLQAADFEYAERFGYVIKPLVVARDLGDAIEARVHPTMVPASWMIADVPGAKNALYVRSYALGSSMYYGAGAGMMPTAMAVVSDLIEVCRNIRAEATGTLPLRSYEQMTERPVASADQIRSRYFLRFGVADQPGVLGQMTTILGNHEISIAQVVQEQPSDAEQPVTVVVLTHDALEGDLRRALAEIEGLDAVGKKTAVIRVAE
ncbi:MAG: homoserine dehydrogenase [Deltaproteobacteria bacterium]|nr:homoserine dehydrogenase [Deltaproteobacteria bacterium]